MLIMGGAARTDFDFSDSIGRGGRESDPVRRLFTGRVRVPSLACAGLLPGLAAWGAGALGRRMTQTCQPERPSLVSPEVVDSARPNEDDHSGPTSLRLFHREVGFLADCR